MVRDFNVSRWNCFVGLGDSDVKGCRNHCAWCCLAGLETIDFVDLKRQFEESAQEATCSF